MRRIVGSTVLVVIALLVVTAAAMLVRATLASRVPAPAARVHIGVDAGRVAQHLSSALRFRTVFTADGANRAEFTRLHDELAAAYPLVHARLVRETVRDVSLLFTWRGTERGKPPLVLMAHLDVVPIAPGTEGAWTRPPYSGDISEGFIYGRGALDDKGAAIAILEAVEELLREGFQPTRTIYLAFGADEEVGGASAEQIVRLLQSRDVGEPAMVLDEGGALFVGEVPGIAGPTAMIGIAEKGYLTLELSVEGPGGHSSMPQVPTQIGRLAAAIARLEAHQFPARLEAPTREMLRAILPVQPFGQRFALANLWLFGPLVTSQLASSPEMASTVRTTIAPTIFNAGDTENVLPARAAAIVNFQILTGDTIETVIARVERTIADPSVKVALLPGAFACSPSAVSAASGPAFAAVATAVQQTLGDTPPLIVPILTGPTDSRHWSRAGARNVFRFTPFLYEKDWMSRAHGTNERISVATLAAGVSFYMQLVRNAETL